MNIMLNHVYNLADKIRYLASIFKDEEKLKLAKIRFEQLSFIDNKIWNIELSTLSDLNDKLKQSGIKEINLSSKASNIKLNTSLRHYISSEDCTEEEKSIINESIANLSESIEHLILGELDIAIMKDHSSKLKTEYFTTSSPLWYPIFSNVNKEDFWIDYIKEKTNVNVNVRFLGSGPKFIPYITYILEAIWQVSKDKPRESEIVINSEDSIVSVNAKWENNRNSKLSIDQLKNMDDDNTQKVSGRVRFLSTVFPFITGHGFWGIRGTNTFQMNIKNK